MEIALHSFVFAIEDPSRQPKVLLQIQYLLNNISSSTTRKTTNEITYGFLPKRPLDLISTMTMPNTCVAHTDTTDTMSFTFFNQKVYYDRKHQPLFIKIGDQAIPKLHKSYSILFSVGIAKKLTQQYIGSFQI